VPKAPTIYLNYHNWDKLEKRFKAEGYPSKYAYIKDLILKDLNIGIYANNKVTRP